MDALELSRIQFAVTASFHFIFPPLSMGLGIMLVAMGIAYLRTGDLKWRQLGFFWTQVYGLIFAMGVATGVVQEFEFGMNWANYSRFVGNVFGSLLAAEGIFAFFLEGGFLGVMLFGGNRLGPRLWLGATCMVVFAAHFSAVWIIMANSWMQTPEGYSIATSPEPTRAVMDNFASVMFTPSFWPRILHVFAASWTAGSALVLSVSAYYILRDRHVELAKSCFRLALPFFGVFAVLNLVLFGANQAIEVTNHQQLKLAAIEGLWDDQSCAPLLLVGWVNESERETKGIGVPCLLSFLSYGSIHSTVPGLNSFSETCPAPDGSKWDQCGYPPVNLAFQAYHVMINLAMFFALMGVVGGALYLWKKKIFQWRWVLWIFVGQVALTEIAITAGWWTAEIGRQPWVVWQVLQTQDGVSPGLSTGEVATSLGLFIALYALLFAVFLFLLNAIIHRGPEPLEDIAPAPLESLPNTLREVFSRRGARASGAGRDPAVPDEAAT